MNICVRYFASIKDDMGMGTVNIQVDDDITAGNLFDQLTSEIQYNGTVLIAVNHDMLIAHINLRMVMKLLISLL